MFEQHFVTQMAFSQTHKDQKVLLLLFYEHQMDLVVGPDKVKNISSMQCGSKIMAMRHGIVVRGGNSIQATVISTRTPIPR